MTTRNPVAKLFSALFSVGNLPWPVLKMNLPSLSWFVQTPNTSGRMISWACPSPFLPLLLLRSQRHYWSPLLPPRLQYQATFTALFKGDRGVYFSVSMPPKEVTPLFNLSHPHFLCGFWTDFYLRRQQAGQQVIVCHFLLLLHLLLMPGKNCQAKKCRQRYKS